MVFRSKGPQVAVVGADGRVHFRAVAIAHDEGSRLELASGVAAGDKVVLNISSRIADGDAVQVQEASAAGPAGGGGSGHAN
jgi:multidrug efflux pump subunit AcrA (membrane-fusion protein)